MDPRFQITAALILFLASVLGGPSPKVAVAAQADAALGDLPLTEVPASGAPSALMAMLLTGDGGYGVTDRGIARSPACRYSRSSA